MTSLQAALSTCLLAGLTAGLASPANANIVLSQVILDLTPGASTAQDIEVWNNGPDRSYIVAQPEEVLSPGQPDEHRTTKTDPAVLGLLVTPQRMILEPGQRRLVRIAAVGKRGVQDRIYRVAIKPVAGDVAAGTTALKVLVGYDVLVIYRPDVLRSDVTAERSNGEITFRNDGNTNVEMFAGRQCDALNKSCRDLPAARLYSGARWKVRIDRDTPVQYRIATASQTISKSF